MNKIIEMPNWMLFGDGDIQKDSYVELLRLSDAATLSSCASVSKNWHEVVNTFFQTKCPGLTVFNVAPYFTHLEEEQPRFNSFKVLEFVEKLGPKIENEANCSVLPMFKGITVRSLCEIAKNVGITVNIDEEIPVGMLNFAEKDTHCFAITNTLLQNSRNLSREERKLALEKTMKEADIDGRNPSVQELVAFNIFSSVHEKPFFENAFAASSLACPIAAPSLARSLIPGVSFARNAIATKIGYTIFVGRTAPNVILITSVNKDENFGSAACKRV